MAIARQGFRAYPGEVPAVFAGVQRGLADAGVAILSVDEANGLIMATTSRRSSWGSDLRVRVWQEDPGLVRVELRSGQRFGVVDWGQGDSTLRHLFFAIDHAVASPQAPAGWHPDPTGRHERRYWDGRLWTDQVADAGETTTDPL